MGKTFGRESVHYDAAGNVTGTTRGPLGCIGLLGLALAGVLILACIGMAVAYPWLWLVPAAAVVAIVWGARVKRREERPKPASGRHARAPYRPGSAPGAMGLADLHERETDQ